MEALDFEDDATFGLLSPAQTAALTARLCDGSEVPTILPYDDEAQAAADTATKPLDTQLVILRDTKRAYHGDGISTVAQLIAAGVFLMPVRKDAVTGMMALDETDTERQIQLNQ